MNALNNLRRFMLRVPIVYRLLIGNSLVILVLAAAATLLTRQFTGVPAAYLILLFSLLGFVLVFLLNYTTIRISLRSLDGLRQTIEQVGYERGSPPEAIHLDRDPDLQPLAEAINAMLSRLENYTQQLRALTERVTSAQEDERQRIARNLHDETSQSLSSLIISLERIERDLPPGASDLKNRIVQARQVATRTVEDLRKIIYDLRPTMLDDLGLIPAVRWYARTTLEEAGMRVQFEIPEENLRLPRHLETELFRIAQEGVNNIARHSNARRVIIRMVAETDHICLELDDNGTGFDVVETESSALNTKHLGLLGIQERAALVGGQVDILSEPGHGTLLRVCLPGRFR
jgi:two-component system, NarL family, sensor histidine kinase UhpB